MIGRFQLEIMFDVCNHSTRAEVRHSGNWGLCAPNQLVTHLISTRPA